jgi:hypothetical protein
MRFDLWVAVLAGVVASSAPAAAQGGKGPKTDRSIPMTEPLAEGDAMPVASGSLVGLAHETSGTVKILQTKDGSRFLRIENLATSNGPDLRIYLVEGNDGTKDELIKAGKFVDLGALKGNVGNQNYSIPKDVDLERFKAMSIWCRRFSVNFAAARLEPVPSGR